MAQASSAAEQFFKEKQPEDIDELVKTLDCQDAATMQAIADASRIGKSAFFGRLCRKKDCIEPQDL
jgi:hypothetical protein